MSEQSLFGTVKAYQVNEIEVGRVCIQPLVLLASNPDLIYELRPNLRSSSVDVVVKNEKYAATFAYGMNETLEEVADMARVALGALLETTRTGVIRSIQLTDDNHATTGE